MDCPYLDKSRKVVLCECLRFAGDELENRGPSPDGDIEFLFGPRGALVENFQPFLAPSGLIRGPKIPADSDFAVGTDMDFADVPFAATADRLESDPMLRSFARDWLIAAISQLLIMQETDADSLWLDKDAEYWRKRLNECERGGADPTETAALVSEVMRVDYENEDMISGEMAETQLRYGYLFRTAGDGAAGTAEAYKFWTAPGQRLGLEYLGAVDLTEAARFRESLQAALSPEDGQGPSPAM